MQITYSIESTLKATQQAGRNFQTFPDKKRKELLKTLAVLVEKNKANIIRENQKDLIRMEDSNPKKDRLLLSEARIDALVQSIYNIAELPNPSNKVLIERPLDNGLLIQKISVPMGVVGVIYESRPNLTIDIAALCLRSGNACVLRGGTDAFHTNSYLVSLIHHALSTHEISEATVELLPTDRQLVKEMLEAKRYIDVIIPRGSQKFIDFVRTTSKIPTIETGAGVCHTFVAHSANLDKAKDIVINAKTNRPSVCNALDTIIVETEIAADFLPMIVQDFKRYKVEIYADGLAFSILKGYPYLHKAKAADFGREFLSYACSIKVVDSIEEAYEHIDKYSSRHSEAIVSEDTTLCEQFLQRVDAAAVYANASTRFTDGGVFGLGAEIGISTQKLHARGPFALEKLVTEKWIIRGEGQIRK